jgi:hypothetical protein
LREIQKEKKQFSFLFPKRSNFATFVAELRKVAKSAKGIKKKSTKKTQRAS